MAWGTSRRKETLPADWHTRRLRVMRRDNWECQWVFPWGGKCLAEATDCDHKDRRGGDDESNLRALCRKHHAWKSAHEGRDAQREVIEAAKKVVARVPEPEPGLLDVPYPPGRRGY